MGFFSFLLMQLMAAYTVLVEPLLRTNFYRMVKKQLNVEGGARVLFYRTQVLWEWSWVVVLVLIAIPISDPLKWMGLTLPNQFGWIILGALLLGIVLSTFLLRRNPGAAAAMQRSLEASSNILPTTPRERKWYAAAGSTAGICEELLYRGFLIHYLLSTFPALDWLLVAILSGIIYGLSRAYQGFKGILQTALTGFSFAIVFYLGGSLLPAIIIHALIDLRPLFVGQDQNIKKKAR
jgi:membrane protease YdiL (CAAX protease family)